MMQFFNATTKGRLDVFLTRKLTGEFSRVEIQNLIKNGDVFVNNFVVLKPSFVLKHGDVVQANLSNILSLKQENQDIKPKNMNIEIVFENENLLIINKPIGLTVHPGAGNQDNTLVNGLLAMEIAGKITLSTERGKDRLGIIHRLDRDTSGLMIVAKNNKIHRLLSEMIKQHIVDRRYIALIHGVPVPPMNKVETYICRNKKDIKKMQVCGCDDDGAKIAITNYKLLKVLNNGDISVVECKLETGRTHQIRLHMQYIKHPIVGEQNYTSNNLKQKDLSNGYNHQMLHSFRLDFREPITGENIFIEKYPDWTEIQSLF